MDDLDRWTRVSPLGSGAYGEVHLAWDREDSRWVALKRFTGQDELGLLRMVIESRIRVSHPHLVRTLAFRLVDDRAWLVTELARGGSVRALIARTGRLPWGWVAEAVDQILAALTALHATGVVHRDLKPANLLLRSHGATHPHLLVGDFGIATWRTVSMTGIGAAIGTPGYLAPEYLDGQSPSPATDLFAVGVLAAELLSGRRLVHLSNASPTIPSSWHDVVPVPAEVPPPLARVLQRMAAPDPTHRYRDCTDAREALLTATPPTHRGDLTTVTVPDLLATLPEPWTPQGPTTLLPPPATPQTTTPPTLPAAEASAPSATTPVGAASGTSAAAAESAEPDKNEPSLVGLPIDGGPTGLILEHEATVQSTGATTALTPPAPTPASGSSTSPLSGSSTEPPSGSSTQPPTGSATFPATPPDGVAPPAAGAVAPPSTPPRGANGKATQKATHNATQKTQQATPHTQQATEKAQKTTEKTTQKAVRRARGRRKAKRALLLTVLVILASGAGTLWWAAGHRAIPGHASAAGGSTRQPPASRWEPVIVGPCDAVDIAQERDGANGRERCQLTDTPGQRQNWVEEPPGGFPKSDPGGPFPDQSCTNDGDRGYSPVGDHLECADGIWQVIA